MADNKVKEDWMQKKWRPMMAMMYMCVCVFDFIIFPIGFTVVQFWETEAVNDAFRQWNPITLMGAGLFHMAMGAILGITAWSRGQEKIAGVATSSGTNFQSDPANYRRSAGGFDVTNNSSFERTSEHMSVEPISNGYKSKKAPVQPPEPEL